MHQLIQRYLIKRQRDEENEGITEDDLIEIKGDISAFRYQLLEILETNGMTLPSHVAQQGISTDEIMVLNVELKWLWCFVFRVRMGTSAQQQAVRESGGPSVQPQTVHFPKYFSSDFFRCWPSCGRRCMPCCSGTPWTFEQRSRHHPASLNWRRHNGRGCGCVGCAITIWLWPVVKLTGHVSVLGARCDDSLEMKVEEKQNATDIVAEVKVSLVVTIQCNLCRCDKTGASVG